MAGRQCAVCGAPPADGQRVRFGIQVAAQRKQCIACRLGFGADVVPQRRVVKCGRGTVPGTVFIVERGGPDPSFGPVKGRFVEKRFGDGRTEILGETLVILFVRHRDVSPGRVFAQVVHVRVAVVHADELHDFPPAFRYFPDDHPFGDLVRQIDPLFRGGIHRYDGHQLACGRRRFVVYRPTVHLFLDFVETLHGQ